MYIKFHPMTQKVFILVKNKEYETGNLKKSKYIF